MQLPRRLARDCMCNLNPPLFNKIEGDSTFKQKHICFYSKPLRSKGKPR